MGIGFRGIAAIAGMALLASGCVTEAQRTKFQALSACDGYGNMAEGGDGITSLGTNFVELAGSRNRTAPRLSAAGVNYCTTALTILDAEYSGNWVRKVSLLQSRALHHLATNAADAALADLDAADAAVRDPNDIFFKRALGFNTSMVRAMALSKAGRKEEAEALALKTAAERPYVRNAGLAALTVVGPSGSRETTDKLLMAAARLHPNLTEYVFRQMFETGRFAEAVDLVDTLKAPVPIRDQTYDDRNRLYGTESQRANDAEFWVDIYGRKAYALQALGRPAEAESALAEAARRIEAGKVTPITLSAKATTEDRTKQAVQIQVNREIETKAPPVLDFWKAMIKAKRQLDAGDAAGSTATMKDVKLASPTSAYFALAAPGETGNKLAQNATLQAMSIGMPPATPAMLIEFLLDAETPTRAQQTMLGFDGLFASDEQKEHGDCKEGPGDDGLQHLCFAGVEATNAITEERALLRAAQKTLMMGGTFFIIERRRDIRHTTVMTNYGMVVAENEMGYESQLDVRILKADQAGPACWRCIDAKQVIAALEPVYRANKPKT